MYTLQEGIQVEINLLLKDLGKYCLDTQTSFTHIHHQRLSSRRTFMGQLSWTFLSHQCLSCCYFRHTCDTRRFGKDCLGERSRFHYSHVSGTFTKVQSISCLKCERRSSLLDLYVARHQLCLHLLLTFLRTGRPVIGQQSWSKANEWCRYIGFLLPAKTQTVSFLKFNVLCFHALLYFPPHPPPQSPMKPIVRAFIFRTW